MLVNSSMNDSKLRSGINWSFIAVAGRHAVQILSTTVLARLLVPEDFGLAAMVGTLINFLTLFLDLGLSWVTIQKEKLDEQQIANLFWINALVGVLIAGACAIASPFAADFYRQPNLTPFFLIQSLTFVFFGAAIQPMALMRRHMRFRDLTISDVSTQLFGTLLTIAMAAAGFGTISLIIPSVVTHAVRTVWVIQQSKMRILRPRFDGSMADYFRVSGRMTSASFFFYFARNLDDVITGRAFGSTAMGFYSRAYLIANMPSQLPAQTVANVVISSVARQRESGDPNWYRSYQKVLIGFSFVVSPAAAGISLVAPELVRIIYGETWVAVTPLLQWLSLAGIFQPAYNSVGWLLVSVGKFRAYFWWSFLSAAILAIGFLTASQYDVEKMAIAYFICGGLILSLPSQIVAHKIAGIPLKKTALDLLKIYIGVGAMAAAVLGLRQLAIVEQANYIIRFLALSLSGALVYFATAKLLFQKLPLEIRSKK